MSDRAPNARLMRRLGLVAGTREGLAITRRRRGEGWSFHAASGRRITAPAVIDRLNALAMPPAYADVRYAADPRAHLQAVGIDADGRPQYRYHPEWVAVREGAKARRLARIAAALPRIRRALKRDLQSPGVPKLVALAACVDLIARTAIRAGGERSEAERGHRGAATLLKRNVEIKGGSIRLAFRGKGGKDIERCAIAPRLCSALRRLMALPGRHLFQYRRADETVARLRAGDVNAYLKDIAGSSISLKDFRTLLGSSLVAGHLAAEDPSPSAAGRKRQIKAAVTLAAEELANTPAIARKSYVHGAVVEAFETGRLQRIAKRRPAIRSDTARVELLAAVIRSG
ncbi:MAG: hypothetical protein QM698_06550 [Micropepsaceae bacterium]